MKAEIPKSFLGPGVCAGNTINNVRTGNTASIPTHVLSDLARQQEERTAKSCICSLFPSTSRLSQGP